MKNKSIFSHFINGDKASNPHETREYVAEALEARILYSAAPVEVPQADVSEATSDFQVDQGEIGQFDSLDSFGADTVAMSAGETEISGEQSVILSSLDNLSAEEIETLADAAIGRWREAGISAEQTALLEGIEIEVVDLEGAALGAAEGTTIYLDWNAAGYDWFIDETPFQDEEFEFARSTTSFQDRDGPAQYGMDLLTAMVHEMGHVLGLDDVYERSQSGSVMYGSLEEGERRVARDGQADGSEGGTLEGVNYLIAGGGSPGDIAVYTNGSTGDNVPIATDATNSFVHGFVNTEEEDNASYDLDANGTDIHLSAGHHLAIYSSRFDATGGANRSEVQTNLNLAGSDLAAGWSQGYIRRTDGADELITSGGAIINVANDDDVLQLQSFRTDNNASVQREPDATGIQLIKLDDSWDYLRLSNADTVNNDSTTDAAITQVGSQDLTNNNFETVRYNDVDEDDADNSSFTYNATTGEITLNANGKFLVFANSYINGGANRTSAFQSLSLDGEEIEGTRTSVYHRGANNANQGAASFGGIIDGSSGQVLTVGVANEGGTTASLDATRTAITIVRLPDTAQTVFLADTTGQNVTGTTPEALTFGEQTEVDPAFSHAAGESAITVNESGKYLFFNNLFQ